MRSSYWTSWSLNIRAKLIGQLRASGLSQDTAVRSSTSELQLSTNSTSNSEGLNVMCWRHTGAFFKVIRQACTHTHTPTHKALEGRLWLQIFLFAGSVRKWWSHWILGTVTPVWATGFGWDLSAMKINSSVTLTQYPCNHITLGLDTKEKKTL